MKTCKDCGETLPLDAFQRYWHNTAETYYYQARCKECRKLKRRGNPQESAYRKKRYWADPERFREASREYQRQNLDKAVARNRERYASNPESRRKILSSNLRSRIGLTFAERDAILAAQGGKCANPLCTVTDPPRPGWCVDHDHSCCPGQKTCGNCVRGILCPNCNLALGHVADDVDRLRGLIEYLNGDRPAITSQPEETVA